MHWIHHVLCVQNQKVCSSNVHSIFLTIIMIMQDLTHIFTSNWGCFQRGPRFEQQIKKIHIYVDHIRFFPYCIVNKYEELYWHSVILWWFEKNLLHQTLLIACKILENFMASYLTSTWLWTWKGTCAWTLWLSRSSSRPIFSWVNSCMIFQACVTVFLWDFAGLNYGPYSSGPLHIVWAK